jgi:hypothetical protein
MKTLLLIIMLVLVGCTAEEGCSHHFSDYYCDADVDYEDD